MAKITNLTAEKATLAAPLEHNEVWQVRGKGLVEIITDDSDFGVILDAARSDAVTLSAGLQPSYLTYGTTEPGAVTLTRTRV